MNIGFIGLGTMGIPMARNLLKKRENHTLRVYDVNKDAMTPLINEGALPGESCGDIGERCDVIISMVPRGEDVEAVYRELIPSLDSTKITVEMSTIAPETSLKLAKKVKETGAFMFDCPVVKSQAAAIEGTLGIYVGGDRDVYEKQIKEILLCMGNNVIHLGDNGAGLTMKICHNMLVGQIQNGVNEMILLAQTKGIGVKEFMKAITYGGGDNFYLQTKGPQIQKNQYPPAFSVENMHKDVHLAQKMIREEKLSLPTVNRIVEVYDQAMNSGYGKEDFSATYKVIKEESQKN